MKENEILEELFARYPVLVSVKAEIAALSEALVSTFAAGGKLLVAGNGGSAADADHIVGELMKSFVRRRRLDDAARAALCRADAARGAELADNLEGALPAIALTKHTALTTAYGNDRSPLLAFAQQVWGYGRAGDLFLAISTSGNAENLLYAAAAAHAKGMRVALLSGKDGGKLAAVADLAVVVPEDRTFAIQELHLPIYHALCLSAEAAFFEE